MQPTSNLRARTVEPKGPVGGRQAERHLGGWQRRAWILPMGWLGEGMAGWAARIASRLGGGEPNPARTRSLKVREPFREAVRRSLITWVFLAPPNDGGGRL